VPGTDPGDDMERPVARDPGPDATHVGWAALLRPAPEDDDVADAAVAVDHDAHARWDDDIEPADAKLRAHDKETARGLSISTKTVESHVSSVLRKLQLSNRHELSRWAAERRIV
jgi:regulatory LuxR family protein